MARKVPNAPEGYHTSGPKTPVTRGIKAAPRSTRFTQPNFGNDPVANAAKMTGSRGPCGMQGEAAANLQQQHRPPTTTP